MDTKISTLPEHPKTGHPKVFIPVILIATNKTILTTLEEIQFCFPAEMCVVLFSDTPDNETVICNTGGYQIEDCKIVIFNSFEENPFNEDLRSLEMQLHQDETSIFIIGIKKDLIVKKQVIIKILENLKKINDLVE